MSPDAGFALMTQRAGLCSRRPLVVVAVLVVAGSVEPENVETVAQLILAHDVSATVADAPVADQ